MSGAGSHRDQGGIPRLSSASAVVRAAGARSARPLWGSGFFRYGPRSNARLLAGASLIRTATAELPKPARLLKLPDRRAPFFRFAPQVCRTRSPPFASRGVRGPPQPHSGSRRDFLRTLVRDRVIYVTDLCTLFGHSRDRSGVTLVIWGWGNWKPAPGPCLRRKRKCRPTDLRPIRDLRRDGGTGDRNAFRVPDGRRADSGGRPKRRRHEPPARCFRGSPATGAGRSIRRGKRLDPERGGLLPSESRQPPLQRRSRRHLSVHRRVQVRASNRHDGADSRRLAERLLRLEDPTAELPGPDGRGTQEGNPQCACLSPRHLRRSPNPRRAATPRLEGQSKARCPADARTRHRRSAGRTTPEQKEADPRRFPRRLTACGGTRVSAESGQFSRWGRGARLTRRVREEYLVYFDRNATQSAASASSPGGGAVQAGWIAARTPRGLHHRLLRHAPACPCPPQPQTEGEQPKQLRRRDRTPPHPDRGTRGAPANRPGRFGDAPRLAAAVQAGRSCRPIRVHSQGTRRTDRSRR